jgi:hypothetical protein
VLVSISGERQGFLYHGHPSFPPAVRGNDSINLFKFTTKTEDTIQNAMDCCFLPGSRGLPSGEKIIKIYYNKGSAAIFSQEDS